MADWVDSWADGLELVPTGGRVRARAAACGPDYARFWAAILDDPERRRGDARQGPVPAGGRLRACRQARRRISCSPSTLTEPTWPTGADRPRPRRDPRAAADSRARPAYVVGGPGLLASLMNAGLLDELRLIVHSLAVHGGKTLFARRQALELVAAAPLAAGRVGLTYRLQP